MASSAGEAGVAHAAEELYASKEAERVLFGKQVGRWRRFGACAPAPTRSMARRSGLRAVGLIAPSQTRFSACSHTDRGTGGHRGVSRGVLTACAPVFYRPRRVTPRDRAG